MLGRMLAGIDASATRPRQESRRTAAVEALSPDQLRMLAQLQARDREVRAHESAHKAVGGTLAGGVSYSYQTGPDGRRYAVGGEVSIDMGGAGDPRTTVERMRQVVAAALAPAQPSAQDRAVAAAARAAMAAAERQIAQADADARAAGQADDAELRSLHIDTVV